MPVTINGVARLRHATTKAVYEFEADELDWDQTGGDEESMGPRLMYEGKLDHPELGTLSWRAWEYPEGILDYTERDIGPHQLLDDFEVRVEFEQDEPEEDDEDRRAQVDAMVEWFHQHYEDPANRLPYESAEGGYQWINGGPFDAREEIRDNFPNVDDDLIDAAVDEVEREGIFDWASQDFGGFYEDEHDLDDVEDVGFHRDEGEQNGDADVDVDELLQALIRELPRRGEGGRGPVFLPDESGRLDFRGWHHQQSPVVAQSPLLENLQGAAQQLVHTLTGTNAHLVLLRAAQNYLQVVDGPSPSMDGVYARGVMLENSYRHTLEQIDIDELPFLPPEVQLASDNLLHLHGAYVMSDSYGRSLVEGAAAYQLPENTARNVKRAAERLADGVAQASTLFTPPIQELVSEVTASVGSGRYPGRSNQILGWVVGGLVLGAGVVLREAALSVVIDGFKESILGAGAVEAVTTGSNTLFNFIAVHLPDIKAIFAALGTDPGWLTPMSRLISKLQQDVRTARREALP